MYGKILFNIYFFRIFEEEGKALIEQFDQKTDAVRQAESRMVEISNLMQTFSTHVEEQAQQIDSIHNTAQVTDENVRGGNTQLRKAIERAATNRVTYMFIFLIAGLSLLFLDSYNK